MKYAQGRLAFGYCDRCGLRYDYKELGFQYVNRLRTGLKVCPDCMDVDHPQQFTDTVRLDEGIVLRDPRPDGNLEASRAFFGWNPICPTKLNIGLGTVRVTT